MRFVTVLVAMVFALAVASVYTQGRGNGQAKKATVSAPKAKSTQTAKQTTKATTKAAKTETRVAKADTRTAKRTAKAETRAAKAEAKATRKSGTTATTATTATTTETTTTATGTRASKLNAEQLAQLPAGMTVEQASAGFKNWGQFVAATNASRNHGIPFDQLKAAMTGIPVGATTMTPTMTPMSLGQAVQSLKGTVVTPTPTTTATTTTTTTPLP
jgi:hypothetical protein